MTKEKSKWHSISWNTDLYLREMEQSKNKRMMIIALFARLKNYHFDNYDQMLFFIFRNNAVAKRLECFSLDKIKATLQYLLNVADYKIALETVEKFILEDPQSLKGEEPILVLSTGEKIYEISRLRELESNRKIFFDKGEWHERID